VLKVGQKVGKRTFLSKVLDSAQLPETRELTLKKPEKCICEICKSMGETHGYIDFYNGKVITHEVCVCKRCNKVTPVLDNSTTIH
jgi:hypothetical protein